MACFKPLTAWRGRELTSSGKNKIVFKKSDSLPSSETLQLPCGKCIGCRLDKSVSWAIRSTHEAQMWDQNCFITLTYDDDHLPRGGTLVKEHFQKFMKRFRKRFGSSIRYFQCGEYGSERDEYGVPIKHSLGRPHYHAVIFNFDFVDKIYLKGEGEETLWYSETLNDLWQNQGFTTVGSVTFESAAYVARYCTKKINGKQKDRLNAAGLKHYERIDPFTGEIIELEPEYANMSRRPGVGSDWYEKFKGDLFPHDFAVNGGRRHSVPAYYRNKFEIDDPETSEKLRQIRMERAMSSPDNTPARLEAREKCKEAQYDQLRRSL